MINELIKTNKLKMSDALPILTRKKLQPKGPKPEENAPRRTENEEMMEKVPPLPFDRIPINKSTHESPSKPVEEANVFPEEIEEGSRGGPAETHPSDHPEIFMPPGVSSKLFWINILVYLNILFLLIFFPFTV
jgi:hypothetical protein